jgi:hypothetical protein
MLNSSTSQALQLPYLHNDSSPRFGGLAHCLPIAYKGAAVPGGKGSQMVVFAWSPSQKRMPAVV